MSGHSPVTRSLEVWTEAVGMRRRRSSVLWLSTACVGALIAALFLRIETVTYATGILIVPERTKEIVAPYAGALTAVRVKPGDVVAVNSVLATLEVSELEAERVRLVQQAQQARATRDRMRAFVTIVERLLSGNDERISRPDIKDPVLGAMVASLHAQIQANAQQLEESTQTLVGARAKIRSLAAIVARDNSLRDQRQALQNDGFISPSAAMQADNTADAHLIDLNDARGEEARALAVFKRLSAEQARLLQDARVAGLRQVEELNALLAGLEKSQDANEFKRHSSTIVSPVEGTVEDLRTTTVPTTVVAGQSLLKIVPRSSQLIVEGHIPDKDIGFARAGQLCRAKIDAFPFTRYGTLHCEVQNIARDREASDKDSFVFRARLDVERARVAPAVINALRPGMGVTVDVITGARSFLSYFLDPLLELADSSLGER